MTKLLSALLLAAFGLPALSAAAESIPRPEYPRPQLERQGNWQNLNGPWEFEFDHGVSGEERGLQHPGASFSRSILVPFCPESELSGIGETDFLRCVWYRRDFSIPADWSGRRILLHFGAVDYEARVWVNDSLAGGHRGGYTPFALEITGLVRPGRENTVVVRAYDDTRDTHQAVGKQSQELKSNGCYYTRTTGIWQTVWLEALPQTFLENYRLFPDLKNSWVSLVPRLDGDPTGLTFRAVARAGGKKVGEAAMPAGKTAPLAVVLSQTRPWSVEDPFLYDLELTLERGGQVLDRVSSYFGLREVTLEGQRVLLNGRPVFQRLVLDQGFYPDGIYTAPSDEALKKDIELSRAVGFNGARLHQKVFEPRFLYWADRLGYLCWGEYPNWGMDHTDPAAQGRMLKEWIEELERDFNHPSIITWTPYNETPIIQDAEAVRNLYRITRAIDPTRPVNDCSGYTHVLTDIFSVHSYHDNTEAFVKLFEPFRNGGAPWMPRPEYQAPYRGQPYIVDEYGGFRWNPEVTAQQGWGYGNPPRTVEEFMHHYRTRTTALLSHPKMFGFCYTQLYDIEQEVNGLFYYDRRPKFDLETLRKINSQPAAYEQTGAAALKP